ncbi:aldehyde dehydrogenase family protein [Undibacterium terreum]|uniref:aldehyde dehydrogenase (NAD(+)) n=1 Tax=Undibacterium terreum TaxID=1224302 RepID=A0A916XN92_9BURK|nr:aldehyde dehydrogenase family protein [Undibacterium terreum]GGC89107.1 aldehyde dehydrogenase [Undibacterium terreum]
MKHIKQIYINGQFATPHGQELFSLINPSTNQLIGEVTLGNEQDTQDAVAAAKKAFKTFSKTSKEQRIAYLQRLHQAVSARTGEIAATMIEEYGASQQFATMSVRYAAESFLQMANVLRDFEFQRDIGRSRLSLEPLGVAALITPWNANASFICNKLATAIAAGCTVVIKPSEMSALQTQLVAECLHEAGLPAGVFNIVNGRGDVVGAELTRHPDIAKISFTGSTLVGKGIARDAAASLKRVTLELGGKSPNILLDDADLATAIPMAVMAAYMNNGQACIAGTRLLVPEHKLEEVKTLVKKAVAGIKVGNPADAEVGLGPLVSVKQYERVQSYIRLGIEEGAELLTGGEGHPAGLEAGNFVKPTVFVNVKPGMRIEKEEIFGPVLSIISYRTEEEAVEIANDTDYGLQAYVSSADYDRASRIAAQIVAGRVLINCLDHDPAAPFGGFKQSGMGREYGVYGLEEYLEPKAFIGSKK